MKERKNYSAPRVSNARRRDSRYKLGDVVWARGESLTRAPGEAVQLDASCLLFFCPHRPPYTLSARQAMMVAFHCRMPLGKWGRSTDGESWSSICRLAGIDGGGAV